MTGYLLALSITATRHNVNDMEEAAYETLERYRAIADWSDERAADLYTRVVVGLGREDVDPRTHFGPLVALIDNALEENRGIYGA